MTNIYVVSDTHFGHANILRFTGVNGVTLIRPQFTSVAEMDQYMVQKWNSIVRPEDHIYHLGDLTLDKQARPDFVRLVRSLVGHKRLILGNHDKMDVRDYREMGFQKVMAYRYFDRDTVLSHVPLHPFSVGHRVNIHGHIHEKDSPPGRYVNVSVEKWDYTPQLLSYMKEVGMKRDA